MAPAIRGRQRHGAQRGTRAAEIECPVAASIVTSLSPWCARSMRARNDGSELIGRVRRDIGTKHVDIVDDSNQEIGIDRAPLALAQKRAKTFAATATG
jgi:hypothetical protein